MSAEGTTDASGTAKRVLVTGASGRTGGIVFEKLLAKEGYATRGMVRSEAVSKLQDLTFGFVARVLRLPQKNDSFFFFASSQHNTSGTPVDFTHRRAQFPHQSSCNSISEC